jgi:hypothetical protein
LHFSLFFKGLGRADFYRSRAIFSPLLECPEEVAQELWKAAQKRYKTLLKVY